MLIGIYSSWLVLVSLFVAMFASYTALDMAGRITASQTRFAARSWLGGGSFAMGLETLVMSLPEFHALVEHEIGDRRPEPDTINVLRNKIPQHLREAYDAEPAAMLRLLESWIYVNDESVTEIPNTKEFLRGSKTDLVADCAGA
ncbi:hypothetical protein BDD14_6564 [Edaphobacter modestus]|uniref:Uncharacterized protein n=1 Tax=Edaphobacter modestus TaxID=388466 RepID=A0A4Q7XY07_9BACT|nr:hypothetical protein BDD14_6564 [Edaphobacter modestus]